MQHGLLASLVLSCFVNSLAAFISRSDASLQTEVSTRWNPFKAVANKVRSAWNPVDKMRGEMCWDREDLLNHEDCMEWMIAKCKKAKADPKRCDKLKKYVKEKCAAGDELGCKYAKELGIIMDSTTIAPLAAAPAPAPAAAPSPNAAPGPTPAAKEEEKAQATTAAPAAKEEAQAAPAAAAPAAASPDAKGGKWGPMGSMKNQKLQSQGFTGKKVRHVDGETMSSDWRSEYGHATTVKTTSAPKSSAWSLQSLKVTSIALILGLTWT